MDIQIKQLSELQENIDNNRNITEAGIKRLTKQILKLGIFKPWLITPDNIIQGGNMRKRVAETILAMSPEQLADYMNELFVDREGATDRDAVLTIYMRLFPGTPEPEIPFNFGIDVAERIIQDLQQIPVTVITPRNESVAKEYSLADNDRAGYYDEDLIANSMPNFQFEWKDYGIDFEAPKTANEYFQGKINGQADAQDKENAGGNKSEVECPSCHFQFEP